MPVCRTLEPAIALGRMRGSQLLQGDPESAVFRSPGIALISLAVTPNSSLKKKKITPGHHKIAPGCHDVQIIEVIFDTDDDKFSSRWQLQMWALESGHFY